MVGAADGHPAGRTGPRRPPQHLKRNLVTNLIGCHGLVWTSDFRPDQFDDVARRIAAAGYDLFEVPLMDPWGFDAERAAATLRDLGLQATLSVGHGPDTDPSSDDPAVAAAGEKLLIQAVDQ